MGEDLPPRFQDITLAHLLSLPVDEPIPFEAFADRLIHATGLTWSPADSRFARTLLHDAISSMIVDVLAHFGALERGYQERPLGRIMRRELVAFRVTPFGRDLLESLG
jgi:hypothetical protein